MTSELNGRVSKMQSPRFDPSPIFEHFRGNYATELLTVAVVHFKLLARLADRPLSMAELQRELRLAERPAIVLITALRAMGLVIVNSEDRLALSELACEHLQPRSPFDVSGYIGFAADSPGVLAMLERLTTNRPGGTGPQERGAIHIYREGLKSAMEEEGSARELTLTLLGRANTVAPLLARHLDLGESRVLLDVGCGSGVYTFGFLRENPQLRAVLFDRPQVLKVAQELAAWYGVTERVEYRPGDMFRDDFPPADVVLFSNVLHDWGIPECHKLIERSAAVLPSGGRLLIHDVFLNDALDGPLGLALYSAQLFVMTEGRAYSAAEFRTWLNQFGFSAGEVIPTLVHNLGVLIGTKR